MPPEEDAYQTCHVDSQDGPEEGEILSDNNLEDISSDESNNIMDWVSNGKSIRINQHLHALCLSSVSDTSSTHREVVPRNRRKRPHHHGHEHRGHCKRRRTCRRRKDVIQDEITSSSDQEDTSLDIRLKAQLKAAVKLDLVENAHKNSLRTRLNLMVNGQVNDEPKSDADIIHDTLEDIASVSEHAIIDEPKNEDIDNELIQLRLAALKTAISNKYAKRKKKKNEMNKENNTEEQAPQAQTNGDDNNENNHITENNNPPTPSLEEDEDVLRAILLASMSKKITSNEPEPFVEPIINNKNLKFNNFNTVNRAFNNVQKMIKVPQVKPLIICLNSESEDSDWDLSSLEKSPEKNLPRMINHKIVADNPVNKLQENGIEFSIKMQKNGEINSGQLSKRNHELLEENLVNKPQEKAEMNNLDNNKLVEEKPQGNATVFTKNNINKNGMKNLENAKLQEQKALSIIESNVEKFLKEQRAKVESRQKLKMHTKIFPANVKPQPKKNPLNIRTHPKKYPLNVKLQSKKHFPNKPKLTPSTPDSEKSAIKFLPANKMEEYQKLQNLLKQKKAQKLLLTKSKANKSTQTSKNSVPEKPKILLEDENFESNLLKKEKQSCSSLLRTTLKQLEMKNSSGRFQIQDKYKDLRVLIKHINQVNKEQKQCEQNVVRLQKELAEAKKNQEELHRKMLTSVTTLANEKKKIDLSLLKSVKPTKAPITSTPIKPSLIPFAISSPLAPTITTLQTLVPDKPYNISDKPTTSKDQPKDSPGNEVRDPNDIDEIIEKTAEKLAVLRKTGQGDEDIRRISRLEHEPPLESCQSSLKPVKANNAPITSTPRKPLLTTATVTSLASPITLDQSFVDDKFGSSIFDQITIKNDQSINDTQSKVRDPNDIDRVIKKTEEKLAVLKETKRSIDLVEVKESDYVSPLDRNERRTGWNPLVIICPFEMNGTCKDSECTFNHFPK